MHAILSTRSSPVYDRKHKRTQSKSQAEHQFSESAVLKIPLWNIVCGNSSTCHRKALQIPVLPNTPKHLQADFAARRKNRKTHEPRRCNACLQRKDMPKHLTHQNKQFAFVLLFFPCCPLNRSHRLLAFSWKRVPGKAGNL